MPNANNFQKNLVYATEYSVVSGTSTTITIPAEAGKRAIIDSMLFADFVATTITVVTIAGSGTFFLRSFADGDHEIYGPLASDALDQAVTVIFTDAASTAGTASVTYHYQGE